MRSALAAVAVLAWILAACASPAASPGGSGASGGPAAGASPSVRPSPSRAPRSTPGQSIVIPHDAPELEARLPAVVDGQTLTTFSIGPDTSFGESLPTDPQGLKDVAAELGDGSGAFGLAYAAPPDGEFNVFAFRVDGADPSALATQFAQMTFAQVVGGSFEAARLGGREVVHIIDPFSEVGDVWFYVDGDTVLGVQAGSASKAADLMDLIT